MSMKNTALATLLGGAMVASVVVTPAHAETTEYDGGYRVAQDATDGAFDGVVVKPGRSTDLYYAHPYSAPGGLNARLLTDVWVNGAETSLEGNTTTAAQRVGNADVVTLVTRANGATITRTFTIEGRSAVVETAVEAEPGARVQLDSTVLLKGLEDGYTGTYDAESNGYHLTPIKPGYEVDVAFGDGTFATAADGEFDGLNNATRESGNGKLGAAAGSQRGRWLETLGDDGRLETSVRIDITTQQDAADSDGDGLPDLWEEGNVTLADGTVLDLRRWGADPDQPDVFLQLNWMPSEWESRGCANRGRFNPTTGETLSFAECAELNKDLYRPTRRMMQDLERLYRENGINLHIDAGPLYAPGIAPGDRRGGQVRQWADGSEPYKENAFSSDSDEWSGQLKDWHAELLGERDAVWHLGVIGDKIAEGETSSGIGLKGESFFVAKGVGLDTAAEFNGTILHEFGHVLGLNHDGAPTQEAEAYQALLAGYEPEKYQERNYIPEYKSAMNYLYQFSHFDLTKLPTTSGTYAIDSGERFYERCANSELTEKFCFVGQSNIPADWSNLGMRTQYIGKADGIIGLPNEEAELFREDISAYELAVLAAAENNKKAGLTLNDDAGNGFVTARTDNVLNVRVENKGFDAHTFKVQVDLANGESAEELIDLKGITDKYNHVGDLAIPVVNLGGIEGPHSPVEVTVTNEDGEKVFTETYRIPVLDYTKDEAEEVLAELPKAEVTPEEKKKVEQLLVPVAQPTPVSTTAPSSVPAAATKVTPRPKPAPAPVTETRGPVQEKPAEQGSSVSGGAIAGIVLAIAGAMAALFGWWYNNGGEFKLPF